MILAWYAPLLYTCAFDMVFIDTCTFQNGGYINPPATLRQFRDPYADWWDKQERRNFGEPLHEDNDILGIFSPYEYTHFKVGWGLCCIGMFIASFLGVVGVVRVFHNPDVPFVERGYEGGLDRELGGEGTVHVSTGALRVCKGGEAGTDDSAGTHRGWDRLACRPTSVVLSFPRIRCLLQESFIRLLRDS